MAQSHFKLKVLKTKWGSDSCQSFPVTGIVRNYPWWDPVPECGFLLFIFERKNKKRKSERGGKGTNNAAENFAGNKRSENSSWQGERLRRSSFCWIDIKGWRRQPKYLSKLPTAVERVKRDRASSTGWLAWSIKRISHVLWSKVAWFLIDMLVAPRHKPSKWWSCWSNCPQRH